MIESRISGDSIQPWQEFIARFEGFDFLPRLEYAFLIYVVSFSGAPRILFTEIVYFCAVLIYENFEGAIVAVFALLYDFLLVLHIVSITYETQGPTSMRSDLVL